MAHFLSFSKISTFEKRIMKKLVVYLSGIVLLLSCNNSAPDAVKYNDELVMKQDSIVSLIDSLDQLIIQRDTIKMLEFQKHVVHVIDDKIESVNKYNDFEGNGDFKNAVIKLFTNYKSIVSEKYHTVISISLLNQVSFEKDSLDKFNNTIKEINTEFSESLEEFLEAQKKFAEKYKFSLVEEIKN